jgi:hypothetical protein
MPLTGGIDLSVECAVRPLVSFQDDESITWENCLHVDRILRHEVT